MAGNRRIGTNARLLRRAAGIKHQEAAELLDITSQYLWEKERGDAPLYATEIDKLAKLYGAKYKDFFREVE